MKIDWEIPKARDGFRGKLDKFIGPGATSAEKNLQGYLPLIAGAAMLFYAWSTPLSWTLTQYVVAALLTIDMLGGVITNATSSAKRWFHREGEGFKQHMSFIGTHFIQLGLFSWAFLDLNWGWIALAGGYVMLASCLILLTPLYLQRPVALILYSVSILLSLYVLETVPGLEWFLPIFYLKLLVSHILKEEPYRPENESVH
ncbi:hypothetical protein [Vibrio profundi]|uniref:hypothetical protein n=1 Tax=Vibrio profundi TaxID=1774960 RepID=UPI0037366828